MISRLRGTVDEVGESTCILDVHGVGYQVFCSARTLAALPGAGEATTLHIETHVREDHIHLFGFAAPGERDCFNLLLGVQGVGARVALAILSVLQPEELVGAVLSQDKAMVARAPGVGQKLAQRIVSELKDKAGRLAIGPAIGVTGPAGTPAALPGHDAVSALVNLGYRPADAAAAVQKSLAVLGAEAALAEVIRDSLRSLAK